MRPLRHLTAIALLATALAAFAQDDKLPELQPIPEPPPPPPGAVDESLEPQVTILKRGEDTVEEFRINGKLYMVKVTPPHGVPYFLIDHRGDGVFSRTESMDTGLRVPQWVIKTF